MDLKELISVYADFARLDINRPNSFLITGIGETEEFMKIEQHWEGRFDDKDLVLDLSLQTKDYLTHKILSENEAVRNLIQDLMRATQLKLMEIIRHELHVVYPNGIK